MKRVPLALVASLLLAGCGQESAAEKEAAALKRAAEQSSSEAADILRNAELQASGNAQAATAPPPKVPADGNGQ
ncbi:MAG TPA: hypothetical protein VFP12_09140 [Allosphingosinicella sp.]|nr:hypothetical protein [Allosphingosinicella sp.]